MKAPISAKAAMPSNFRAISIRLMPRMEPARKMFSRPENSGLNPDPSSNKAVTLPLIRPGVIAGSVFAFIVSFDQFPVSLFLVQPGVNTLPIQLFNYLKYSFDPTVAAAATVSIALSITMVLLLEKTIGLQEYVKL